MIQRPIAIAVCAPGEAAPEVIAIAEAIGAEIARAGCVVVTGGLGGAMEAACRGAKAQNGTTIGILPGYDHAAANPSVDHIICTGLGQARNTLVVATAHAVIAVGGGVGTLSEIALALRLGRPVVAIGEWAAVFMEQIAAEALAGGSPVPGTLYLAETVESAVEAAVSAASITTE